MIQTLRKILRVSPCLNILVILFAVSDRAECTLTISCDPPLNDLICVGRFITFAAGYDAPINVANIQYQWSNNGGGPGGGNNRVYTVEVYSQSIIIVTCEVFVDLTNGTKINESLSIPIQPNGNVPQIDFNNSIVYKLSKWPFNLTATIVSNSSLTSLYWSAPGLLPNRTILVHHGNTTTTTFMLLKNATVNDSGEYSVTAVNDCGIGTGYLQVQVHINCPLSGFISVEPSQSFTTVESYRTSVSCSFNGYSLSFVPQTWVLLPQSQTPVPSFNCNCNCLAEIKQACSTDAVPYNDCCKFHLITHCTPYLNNNNTMFFCTNNHSDDTAKTLMVVAPSPKVIEPPRSLTTAIGSKAVFTCDFEASTDSKIAQILWEFNGDDLAGCRRFQDRINCTVTQNSTNTNYISSTLEINSVQADNAGQYTCYCSYDTSVLNVDDVQVIQSDRKSATLSVQLGSSRGKNLFIGVSVGILTIIIIFIIIVVTYRVYVYHIRSGIMYMQMPVEDEPLPEITDEMLDQYIVPELLPFWEKLGKALNVPNDFLKDDLPADPAERLKAVLREWRATDDHPLVYTLNKKLKQLGLKDFIPQ